MIDSKIKKCAVLYSGGTDSTLAAALTCREYDHIHLVTYHRFGFFSSENPGVNALKLIEKYPDKYITFIHFLHTSVTSSILKIFLNMVFFCCQHADYANLQCI
jgi:asparagine synthetase B (glutamine-hydrolysing)